MKKVIVFTFFILSFASISFAQTSQNVEVFPEGFVSDGCSKFPDGNYRDCCVAHDVKYFKGGSWKERWRADNDLRKCVAAKKGFHHKPLSITMWMGVRAFGVPWLPTKFRWGFGKKK